jgi:hypothetical protein
MAAPHPLERKKSTVYAPHKVAVGIDTSLSEEEEQLPVRGLSQMRKVRVSTYPMSHSFVDIGSCFPHSQAETPYGSGDGAADGQGDTAELVEGQDTCH